MLPARYRRRAGEIWSGLPAEVAEVISSQIEGLTRGLAGVRTPQELRRRLAQPALRAELVDPLAPALDRICGLVARSTVPISPTVGHALVTASSLVGSTLDSGLGALGLACSDVPPVACSLFAAAGTLGLATELVEFWVLACAACDGLRAAADGEGPLSDLPGEGGAARGPVDRAQLRQVLVAAYLGPRTLGGPLEGSWRPVAQVLLRRVAVRWVPLVGIPTSMALANRDLLHARRLARRLGPGAHRGVAR